MNTSSAPVMGSPGNIHSERSTAITSPSHLLPVPVPDWTQARSAWGGCWPAHVYGFGSVFLLAAALSLASPPYCFRCHRLSRSTAATSTVNGIVGVVCFGQSCVLLIDAYHSTGRLPVALVQMVHGLVFPGVVATLTILDRIFSALVKPRQQVGTIKHPRLIATALSVYLLSTSATYLVIGVRPDTRLWLLLCQVVSLAWGCAGVFLVACQCLRLSRYARVTARSRRQTAMYVRAKRHVEQRLDSAHDTQRRCQLLKHLSRLRVARTKADEFAHQQQRMLDLDEQGFSDVDLQMRSSSTTDSSDDQLPPDFEVTKTTTVKVSHNHFRRRRRSRRRCHVTGSRSACRGSDAVRDFTVTALAAARLLWSPSPDTDGQCDEGSSWQVCLRPADAADSLQHRLNDCTTGDRKPRDHRTSATGTDTDDDVDNDVEETNSSSEARQHPRTDTTNADAQPVLENLQNITKGGRDGERVATGLDEAGASSHRQQLEAMSFVDSRRNVSSVDASSRTCLLLDSTNTAAQPLSRRLSSATRRLLRRAVTQWRQSRHVSSRFVEDDVESSRRIACIAESYVLDAARLDVDSGSQLPSTSTTGHASHDAVVFENRAYDCLDEPVDSVEQPSSSVQNTTAAAADECRQASSGYLADTELDNVDWRQHDPDTSATPIVALPGSSVYLGLSRLRGGRTVRLVWRTATVAVTSACLVCCLHIYAMLGVFGVLSNDRPASAWPWFGFQTLYRLLELVYFYALLAVTWSLQRRTRRRHVTS